MEFEKQRQYANDRYKNLDKQRLDLDKDIKLEKEILFKSTQDLFKLRENEANLYGEIQANVSACKNY